MIATLLAPSAPFPEILGEMALCNDQASLSNSTNTAVPRVVLADEDNFANSAPQNEQILWESLGTWDL